MLNYGANSLPKRRLKATIVINYSTTGRNHAINTNFLKRKNALKN